MLTGAHPTRGPVKPRAAGGLGLGDIPSPQWGQHAGDPPQEVGVVQVTEGQTLPGCSHPSGGPQDLQKILLVPW